MPKYSLALRPVATVAMAVAVLLFVLLGNWQLERATAKRIIDEQFSRAEAPLPLPPASIAVPRYQRVTASGSYDTDHQFLLEGGKHLLHAGRGFRGLGG